MKWSFSYFAAPYVDLEDYCDHMSVCQFQKGTCWLRHEQGTFPFRSQSTSQVSMEKAFGQVQLCFTAGRSLFRWKYFLHWLHLYLQGSIVGENKLGFIVVVPSFCIALLFPGDSVSLPLAFFQWLLSHIGGSW